MNVIHSVRKQVFPEKKFKERQQYRQNNDPRKKRESEDYIALILEETKVLKHKLKIHQT